MAEEDPPGSETPLLIDPSSDINPLAHIEYVCATNASGGSAPSFWWARPRNGSSLGNTTVSVCDLNRSELLEVRNDYVRDILEKQAEALLRATYSGDHERVKDEYARAVGLLERTNMFVGLAFDFFRKRVPSAGLSRFGGMGWPTEKEVWDSH